MNTVFIGGSRHVQHLNSAIREALEHVVQQRMHVVIGDADGSDRAAQAFLAEKLYGNVVVYCMEGICRHNLGGWVVRPVKANGKRGFDYYALKDLEMVREADWALMIWDGKSKGTLLNILRMLEYGKPTVVYFAPSNDFKTIQTRTDLLGLLQHCSHSDFRGLRKYLGPNWEQVSLFVRE